MHIQAVSGRVRLTIILALAILLLFTTSLVFADNKGEAPEAKKVATETAPAFSSNELLIKIKRQSASKITNSPDKDKTGIASIDEKNTKHKAVKFEKVAKQAKSSKQDHAIFSWYIVTFEGEQKLIKQGEQTNSNDQYDRLTAASEDFKKDPSIEAVEFNREVKTLLAPNDPFYGSSGSWGQTYADLWGLKKINSEGAWNVTTGSPAIVVADVDTGVDRNHEDLAANMWINNDEIQNNGIDDDSNGYIDDYYGWDWVGGDNDPMDDHGHGTHTAGTIAAAGNNSVGVAGVSWNSKIMALKFLAASGSGSISNGAAALVYAADNGAHITSNSWGCVCEPAQIETDAIRYGYERNVVTVAAAGNNSSDALDNSPAAISEVITVAASTVDDTRASFSNFGPKTDVTAPGVDILSTRASVNPMCTASKTIGNYCRVSGTSMATPHVAGLAALLLSRQPDLKPEEVRQLVRVSADKIAGKDWENNFGYGRISADKALRQAIPPVAKIRSPLSRPIITQDTGVINVIGDVSARAGVQSYVLAYGSGSEPASFTAISSGASEVLNGQIGQWDTSSFPLFSEHTLRLTVTDTNGIVSVDRVVVTIDKSVLPGWPKTIDKYADSQIAAGDVDGDGKAEVISGIMLGQFSTTLQINVWRIDGSSVAGWPKNVDLDAIREINNAYSSIGGLTVADIDGDNRVEVIGAVSLASPDNYTIPDPKIYLFVLNEDGSFYPGWPKVLNNPADALFLGSSPALSVGDVNGDQQKDIIFRNPDGNVESYNADGSMLSGWPRSVGGPNLNRDRRKTNSTAPLADIDQNGTLEIFASSHDGKVYGFNGDGSTLAGWPQAIAEGGMILRSPNVGDIDGDGKLNIAAQSYHYKTDGTRVSSNLTIWNTDGSVLKSRPSSSSEHETMFADLNGDRMLEQIVFNDCCKVRAYRLDGSLLPGFPVPFNSAYSYPTFSAFDIEGDGKAELGIMMPNGQTIINGEGQIIWQRVYSNKVSPMPPLFGDFDKDGKAEVAGHVMNMSLSQESKYYIWKTDFTTSPGRIDWTQHLGSERHIGTLPSTANPDTTGPTVNFISPTNGSVVSVNRTTVIKIDAADSLSGVTKVEMYAAGKLLCTDLIGLPYECSWFVPKKRGQYTVEARAYDLAGNMTKSTITVTAK